MVDVLIVCEGHTERDFCKAVIAPHLAGWGIRFAGTLAGKADKKRLGIGRWALYRKEALRLAGQQGRHVGVLVDYYGMPTDWPGREQASQQAIDNRGQFVENSLRDDLPELTGRFHPCVALHEYESLLFVEPESTSLTLSVAEGCLDEAVVDKRGAALAAIKDSFQGHVERINDSYETKPSKRCQNIFTGYDKVFSGVEAAKEAGVTTLRSGCPWLHRWLTALESLGARQ